MRLFMMLLSLMLMVFHVEHAAAADINQGSWSENDGGNNQAPPAGWPAGMAPSAVEPTARAMMGATKRWYDHQNCVAISAGSANAQTLTYAVAPQSLSYGDTFCFGVGAGLTNTGPATLNINSLGAKPVWTNNASSLGAGALNANTYVTVTYDGAQFRIISTSNAVSGNFLIQGGGLRLDNGQSISARDTGGTYRNSMVLDLANNLDIGDSGTPGGICFSNNGHNCASFLDQSDNLTIAGSVFVNNNGGYLIKDGAGTYRFATFVDSSNNLHLGDNGLSGNIFMQSAGGTHASLDGSGNFNITGSYRVNGGQIGCGNLANGGCTNASNLISGTLPSGRLSGPYSIGNLVVSNAVGGGGGNIGLDNGEGLLLKDTGGTYHVGMLLDGANNLNVGDTGISGAVCFKNVGTNCDAFVNTSGNYQFRHGFVGYQPPGGVVVENLATGPITYLLLGDNGNVQVVAGSSGQSCTYSGGASWSCGSDARLKITKPLDNADGIMALSPVSYRLKSQPDGATHLGFTAQDVEKVYPELVSEENGYLSLEYDGLIAPLVAAVQKLSKRVDELEAELKANKR